MSDERLIGFRDGATAAAVRIASDEYLQGYVSGQNAAIRARDDQADALDVARIAADEEMPVADVVAFMAGDRVWVMTERAAVAVLALTVAVVAIDWVIRKVM